MISEDSSQSINERMAALRQRMDQECSSTHPQPTPPNPDESKVPPAEPEKHLESVERSMDAPRTGPLEVNYLSDDSSNIANAIELHFSSPESQREADLKQLKWFWMFVAAFAIICVLSIWMQNALLTLIAIVGFFALVRNGVAIMRMNRPVGWTMIGSVTAVACLALFGQHLHHKIIGSKCAHSYSYRDGYAFGKISAMMDVSGSCNDMIQGLESEMGSTIDDHACYCEGWKDGRAGRPSEYKEHDRTR